MAGTTTDSELRYAPTVMQDWQRSDAYHNSFLISEDEVLANALKNSCNNGLPSISVSDAQGKLLKLLVLSIGAKRILEIGTLGGYSTIWMAQGLPEDGEIVTFEISEKHAEVARQNIANAGSGLASKVKVVVGPAIDSLRKLQPEQPYDFVFIDADKPSNQDYFIEAKRLVRKGAIIIIDNVVRNGLVSKPEYSDDNVEGVRRLLKWIQSDKEVDATTIATVGDKGYDGFLYARKL